MNEIESAAAGLGRPYIPMTFSQVLDRVWAILRGKFGLFLQLGLLPAGVMLLVYGAVIGAMFALGVFPTHAGTQPDPQRLIPLFLAITLLACIPFLLTYALFEGAATIVTLAANCAPLPEAEPA